MIHPIAARAQPNYAPAAAGLAYGADIWVSVAHDLLV
jgi:hypothetical protein